MLVGRQQREFDVAGDDGEDVVEVVRNAASEGAHAEFARKLMQTREQAIREYEEANGPRQFTMTRGEALDAFNKGTGVARTNKILRTIVGVK